MMIPDLSRFRAWMCDVPTGADHCHNMHDTSFVTLSPLLKEMAALGITSPLPANDLRRKGAIVDLLHSMDAFPK